MAARPAAPPGGPALPAHGPGAVLLRDLHAPAAGAGQAPAVGRRLAEPAVAGPGRGPAGGGPPRRPRAAGPVARPRDPLRRHPRAAGAARTTGATQQVETP